MAGELGFGRRFFKRCQEILRYAHDGSSSAKRAFYVKRSCTESEVPKIKETDENGSDSADDDHRQLGMGEYFLSLAAEEECRYAAAAMRCHDDRVAFLLPRGGQDRFPRRGCDGLNRGESNARGF